MSALKPALCSAAAARSPVAHAHCSPTTCLAAPPLRASTLATRFRPNHSPEAAIATLSINTAPPSLGRADASTPLYPLGATCDTLLGCSLLLSHQASLFHALHSISAPCPPAVCLLGGGGMRAATLALGWLRALHILGVLPDTIGLHPQQLGQEFPPEQCHLTHLGGAVRGPARDLVGSLAASTPEALSLHPALQQGARSLIALVPTDVPLDVDVDTYAAGNKELAGLFGRWVDPTHGGAARAAAYNAQRQVFPSAAFDSLLARLQARQRAGGAAVVCDRYPVLPNAHVSVQGGHTVRVLWAVNAQQLGWEAALPADTRWELHHDRTMAAAGVVAEEEGGCAGELDAPSWAAFPHLPATCAYPPELVGLMGHHAAHMLLSAAEEVRDMAR